MAKFVESVSRTFGEYLLIPGFTPADLTPDRISLATAITRHRRGERGSSLRLNLPFASSVMQAVSNDTMAIALAKAGGISFIYQSQAVEAQARMVAAVKRHKAGFVRSDSNLRPSDTFRALRELIAATHHSTVAITDSGAGDGLLLGLVSSKDFRVGLTPDATPLHAIMTPVERLSCAREGVTLEEANEIIWERKLDCLPILKPDGRLSHLVFRKDIIDHLENPQAAVDGDKRYLVGAGINTRDYEERVPALLEAGADVLCIDSSDGFSEYQGRTLAHIRGRFGGAAKVGAGNVVDRDGFNYLADCGADFVKVGIGGGSICITREQKGIGRGQATAVIEVAKARDDYFARTGEYVPICSDGGIVLDNHITLALAMGADFIMMGRHFARFDEAPTEKKIIGGQVMKEYWAEGTNRAQNWARYDLGGDKRLAFEEGVDGFVPYAGPLKPNVEATAYKIRSTMANCGARSIPDFHEKAQLTLVSSTSIREGGYHDVHLAKEE